jgi:DNA-binding IclR family transcriptional regulator
LPLVSTPRSDLLRRVLDCLGDHPHDNTIDRVARRLGLVSADAVEAALTALEQETLVTRAGDHWQLTHHGWAVSRAADADSDSG